MRVDFTSQMQSRKKPLARRVSMRQAAVREGHIKRVPAGARTFLLKQTSAETILGAADTSVRATGRPASGAEPGSSTIQQGRNSATAGR